MQRSCAEVAIAVLYAGDVAELRRSGVQLAGWLRKRRRVGCVEGFGAELEASCLGGHSGNAFCVNLSFSGAGK